jgi:hypothetical protein
MDFGTTIKSLNFEKLKGQSNFELWKVRITALLTAANIEETIDNSFITGPNFNTASDNKAKTLITMSVEDGPLIQIKDCKSAYSQWQTLQKLYSPTGFNAEFLLLKELFESNLSGFNSMEEFLNRIKYLTNSLVSKEINIPNQLIVAWVLNNLSPTYEGFVTSVTQSYRNKSAEIDLENLFSNLIDESRRQSSLSTTNKTEKVLLAKPTKITKPLTKRYCNKCKVNTHFTNKCWYLFPENKPKWFKTFHDYEKKEENEEEEPKRQQITLRKKPEKALINQERSDTTSDEMEIDQVLITSKISKQETNFILDSGSSQHIVSNKQLFSSLKEKTSYLQWGNNSIIKSNYIGNIVFQVNNFKIYLNNCLYVPEFNVNLISVRKLLENNYIVNFQNTKASIIKNNKIILEANLEEKLYTIKLEASYLNKEISNKNLENIKLWHTRYGHKNLDTICRILSIPKPNIKLNCSSCIKAKLTNTKHIKITPKAKNYLDKIVIDLCGPIMPKANNKQYIIFFLDSATRNLKYKLLESKSEAFQAFIEFKNLVENQSNKKIKIIKSDNGLEFKNQKFTQLCISSGIIQEFNSPYTAEQNGLIERINRTIIETTRAYLYYSRAPLNFWNLALDAAVYIYNITPHASLNFITPHEKLYNKKPIIKNLKTWGSIAYYLNKTQISKLEPRSKLGILVGFNSINYKVLDIESKRVIQTRDVKILENNFYNFTSNTTTSNSTTSTSTTSNKNLIDLNSLEDFISSNNIVNSIENTTSNTTNNTTSNSSNSSTTLSRESSLDPLDPNYYININNKRSLLEIDTTYKKRNNNNYNLISELAFIITENNEPKTYLEAINNSNSKEWLEAMQAEINQLESQNVWNLVDRKPSYNILKGRWVYKIKTDENNNLVKYKARWVIKGYNQIYGLDYLETFANTTRIEVIRLLLFLAAYLDLEIIQLDIKNAFLHAPLDETIYMEQPTGFSKNTKICKLNKSLYGLKQAPRAWYLYLKEKLALLEFFPIFSEQGIFTNKTTKIDKKLFIIVYVDDILIIGKDINLIKITKLKLSKLIEVTDLGEATYFLGIEITRNRKSRTIKLSQTKYSKILLEKYNKNNLNPISTPSDSNIKLNKNEEKASLEEINLYQQYVGSLIYLTTRTRPDLAFSVYNCARYMSNPSKQHYNAVNRIFKYLNYSLNKGLESSNKINPNLIGFTDADWGGDLVTRKSTTGYLFLFNNTPISWASKLQKTTALSSCEAEYMAIKEAIKEYIYLINIFKQLQINELLNKKNYEFYLFTDNKPAIDLANNPEHHSKTKHIDIQYHFVREKIQEGSIKLDYINTKNQLADILTKSLNNSSFQELFSKLNIK